MKNNLKKLLSVFLCAVLIFTTASVAFAADGTRTVVDSGYCGAQGENLTWTLYSDGELVISGEGEMDWYFVDYDEKGLDVDVPPPWYDYYPVIDVITFEEGVTGIGNAAFSGEYNRFHRVNFPKSLKYFDGEFYWDEKTCDQGRYIAVCYAGTEEQWNQVEKRTYAYSLNDEKDGYNRKLKSAVKGYKFDRLVDSENEVLLCFNGEEPAPFIKLKSVGVQRDFEPSERFPARVLRAYYYPGDYENVEINWKIKDDSIEFFKFKEDSGSTDLLIEATLKAVSYGKSDVIVELVDAGGKVLASDKASFYSTVPVDMNIFESIYYYGSLGFGMIGGTWLAFTFGFFVYLEWFLMAPASLFYQILELFGGHKV
ncbi:MAG: hypothetical protein IKK85_08055 [Clostridia bacterium]|nr:hypothetical protein [Clostridia bacterium]